MKKRVSIVLGVTGIICLLAVCVIYIPYEETPEKGERPYPSWEEGRVSSKFSLIFVYDYLAPHGYWVTLSPYGYVWIPRYVPYRWRPYTHGRWLWTDLGWYWVSNFDWGWLTFHYGRWGYDNRLGWFWVPGTLWAPAWVVWAWGDIYIGWAAIPPEIEWIQGVGFFVWPLEPPAYAWVFIEGRHFPSGYLNRYILPFERNRTVLNFMVSRKSLAPRGSFIINEGIEPASLAKWTKTEIKKYEIVETGRQTREIIGAKEITVFRPTIVKEELAKPKETLQVNLAEREITAERARRLDLRELEVERRNLEQSQKEEEFYFRRKMEEERAKSGDQQERQEVEKRYQVQLEQLKKQHEAEKSEFEKRQEEVKKKAAESPRRKKK